VTFNLDAPVSKDANGQHYRHNEHLVAVTELPLRAKGASGTDGIETIDGYHVARWSDANLAHVAVSARPRSANSSRRSGVGAAQRPSLAGREPLVAADRTH
jgi:hypothetical protein